MNQAAPQRNPMPDPKLDQDLAGLSVAELHAYIHRLRDNIQGLQDYNNALYAELTELQRSEFFAVMNRA